MTRFTESAQEATLGSCGVTSSKALQETCPLLGLDASTLLSSDGAGPVFTVAFFQGRAEFFLGS